MRLIHGAKFMMGSKDDEVAAAAGTCPDADCKARLLRETPAHDEDVVDFYLDETEVPATAFVEWLNREPGVTIAHWGGKDNGGTYVLENAEPLVQLDGQLPPGEQKTQLFAVKKVEHPNNGRAAFQVTQMDLDVPMNYVTYIGASLYCRSRNARLPTEAEWELAARGKERRAYPWNDADKPRCTEVSYGRLIDVYLANGAKQECPGTGPQAVGTARLDRTPEGIADLGGNVSEWTDTPWRETYSAKEDTSKRVIRGGSWKLSALDLRSAARTYDDLTWADEMVGFRCARSVAAP
jgi:formylglycine-generating enzyme required for sulfatase activity